MFGVSEYQYFALLEYSIRDMVMYYFCVYNTISILEVSEYQLPIFNFSSLKIGHCLLTTYCDCLFVLFNPGKDSKYDVTSEN